jgi:purine-cytosine permease-like protein
MVGTLGYGLGLRDASLVIIFFSLIAYIPPAFMGTLGPGTGLRQMIQARYAFGYTIPYPYTPHPSLLPYQQLTNF